MLKGLESESEVAQSCPTLCDPMDCSVAHQTPPSMEFSRQEYWGGLPFPSPGNLLNLGIEPGSPALQADTSPSEPPGNPERFGRLCLMIETAIFMDALELGWHPEWKGFIVPFFFQMRSHTSYYIFVLCREIRSQTQNLFLIGINQNKTVP